MDRKLLRGVKYKTQQQIGNDIKTITYARTAANCISINGRSALSWISEFTDHAPNMVGCFTRVRSENTNALFFVKLPAERLDDFKRRVDPIIGTLQIP
jgi:very-short-patch-repair endonuclease